MSKIQDVILELHEIEGESSQKGWLQNLHPLVKILITILYIIFVVSLYKYNLSGLLLYGVYPIVILIMGDLSAGKLIKRLKIIFGLLLLLGIANPFFDKKVLFMLGNVEVTGGILSMITLWLKGILTISASYLLMVSTPVHEICYGLRCMHVPRTFVSIFLLVYRYIFVLLEEVNRMTQAYALRAPNQKGVHYKAWGSMVGMLLLRSIDFSEMVYQSMALRGYHGEFPFSYDKKGRGKGKNVAFLLGWIAVFFLLRGIVR